MTTKRISLEGVEARNDLIKFGVEEALVSSEGTLVLGEKSDSLFKASESLGTSVISHRREAMKAPKMIATVPKGLVELNATFGYSLNEIFVLLHNPRKPRTLDA